MMSFNGKIKSLRLFVCSLPGHLALRLRLRLVACFGRTVSEDFRERLWTPNPFSFQMETLQEFKRNRLIKSGRCQPLRHRGSEHYHCHWGLVRVQFFFQQRGLWKCWLRVTWIAEGTGFTWQPESLALSVTFERADPKHHLNLFSVSQHTQMLTEIPHSFPFHF